MEKNNLSVEDYSVDFDIIWKFCKETDDDFKNITHLVEQDYITEVEDIYKINNFNFIKYLVENKLDISKYKNVINIDIFNIEEDKLSLVLNNYPEIKQTTKLSNIYTLWKNDLISDETLIGKYKDLKIIDKKWFINYKITKDVWLSSFYFMFDNTDDISNNSGISSYEFVEKLEDYVDDMGDNLDFDSAKYEIGDLTLIERTIIMDKFKELEIILDEDEIDELDIEDFDYDKLREEVLNDNSNDTLISLLELNSVYDIKSALTEAYRRAKEDANSSEIYNVVKKEVSGFFVLENLKFDNEHILLPFDSEWANILENMKNYNEDDYMYDNLSQDNLSFYLEKMFESEEGDISEGDYSKLPEKLKISEPYYGWDGTIKDEDFRECVRDSIDSM